MEAEKERQNPAGHPQAGNENWDFAIAHQETSFVLKQTENLLKNALKVKANLGRDWKEVFFHERNIWGCQTLSSRLLHGTS